MRARKWGGGARLDGNFNEQVRSAIKEVVMIKSSFVCHCLLRCVGLPRGASGRRGKWDPVSSRVVGAGFLKDGVGGLLWARGRRDGVDSA